MRITKTQEDVIKFEDKKRISNVGCNICPCCGETKTLFEYLRKSGDMKGISGGICRTWTKGFFKIKSMRVDCYTCNTCGAEWESDPYEY